MRVSCGAVQSGAVQSSDVARRRCGWALRLGALLAVVVLGGLWLWWLRGPQPDLQPPSPAARRTAAVLMEQLRRYLRGEGAGGSESPPAGQWYATVYPRDGGRPRTVQVLGALSAWAAPLRAAWPGRIELDRVLDPVPAAHRWPLGWGLDVGLDGWIEDGGAVHLPVEFSAAGYRSSQLAAFMTAHPGRPLRTHAWVATPPGPRWMLRGSIDPGPIDATLLRARVNLAGDYLARHLRQEGQFDYLLDARFGRPLEGYNVLRHAGAVYSLYQLYLHTRRPRHRRAAEAAAGWLRGQLVHSTAQPGRCFVVEGREAKLGGAALTLLALVERARAGGGEAGRELMRCLAEHLVSQTDPDGDMSSYYAEPGVTEANTRRSVYYPGEAVLALSRYAALDRDPIFRRTALRAARYLVRRRWRALGVRVRVPPDAWLLQALEELHRVSGEQLLADYAFEIAAVITRGQLAGPRVPRDLLGGAVQEPLPSVITAGARGEALAAAARLERRLRPGAHRLRDRLLLVVRYLLRNQYTEPILIAMLHPGAVRGGFRSSPVAPTIRIDGVQHPLSCLLGLLDLLELEEGEP